MLRRSLPDVRADHISGRRGRRFNPVTPTTFSHVSDVVSVHCGAENGPVGGNWEDPLSIMDFSPGDDHYPPSQLGQLA